MVEAVEAVGQLPDPGGHLVGRPLLRQLDHLGQRVEGAHQLELCSWVSPLRSTSARSARATPSSSAFLPMEWMRAWAYWT